MSARAPDLFAEADPVLFDAAPTLAQARAANRLVAAVGHIHDAIALLWDTDLQQFRVPPLSPAQVEDALRRLRGLRRTLAELEDHVEDALNREEN